MSGQVVHWLVAWKQHPVKGESKNLATVQVESPPVAAKRVVRKTLSRKSPFLPEVLPSLINYGDITYCKENGQNVLLGEGSFGQASSSSV